MPIKNLVFEGGGVKGIAYVGALQVLHHKEILQGVERVAGASAGAITALLLALGYHIDEVEKILWEIDFKKFQDDDLGLIRDTDRLLNDFGWFKGDYCLEWLQKVVQAKTGSKFTTFEELETLRQHFPKKYKTPYFVIANLSRKVALTEYASFENAKYKNWSLALAVRASMSIPLYFAAVKVKQEVHVDGGLTCNYPIHLFDKLKYLDSHSPHSPHSPHSKNPNDAVFNTETLGFRLDTKEEIDLSKHGKEPERVDIGNFQAYTKCLVKTIMNVQNVYHYRSKDPTRSVYCNTLNVSTIDFGLSEDKKRDLIASGGKATREFLDDMVEIDLNESKEGKETKEMHSMAVDPTHFREPLLFLPTLAGRSEEGADYGSLLQDKGSQGAVIEQDQKRTGCSCTIL